MLYDSASTQSHPRRPPAHLSFSLAHSHGSPSPASSTCSLRAQAARDEENRQSCLTWKLSPVHRNLEESNETTDSQTALADMWFDQSNKDVDGKLYTRFLDNDPPFFLQNHDLPYPNLGTDTEQLSQPPPTFDHNISQFAPEFARGVTNGSSIDDFRSVIDDLTIENKRLRERLRKHEKSYGAHLEKDKLFEVKVHGLNPRKKRELEETLRAFASSISKDESTDTSTSERSLKNGKHPGTSLRHDSSSKIASSTSTNSRLVDSAYASLSTAGPISTSTPNQGSGDKKGGQLPPALKMDKVQSFLDDIPRGLLPKHPTVMTERGKKKLVVRRLEQLFTGKLKAPRGTNGQPEQQQEVSNSAARDDRQAIERRGQQVSAEGVREAHILDTEMEVEKGRLRKLPGDSSTESSTASQAEGVGRNTGSPSSPDQRPTRPLDLDPDRAQVPAENIEYIRHLGVSTPLMTHEDSVDAVVDDNHGWVYLNLLFNMAQLHIINVTPDFIRLAVTELSTKFQLSPDGRKIRWKGGIEGTELSSDSGADSALRPSPNDSDSLDEGSQKRRKVDSNTQQGSAGEQNAKKGRFSSVPITGQSQNRPVHANELRYDLHYKPLFAHHSSSEEDDMSLDESISPISYGPADESGTGGPSNDVRAMGRRSHSGSSSKRKRDDGAIVFYSGAPFFTDLSGDRDSISTPLNISNTDIDGFSNHGHDALGCAPKRTLRPIRSRTSSGSILPFRPFEDYSGCVGPLLDNEACSQSPDVVKIEDDDQVNFSPPWALTEEQENVGFMSMEACGLGGTRPADHFAILVETRRRKLDRRARLRRSQFSPTVPRNPRVVHVISKSSLDLFRPSNVDHCTSAELSQIREDLPLEAEILSTRVQYLNPSGLPPPAIYHGTFSSSTDWSDDSSSEDDREVIPGIQRHPQFIPRTLNSASPYDPMDHGGLKENYETSETDASYTSSIDILALAGEIDPDAVAAKEGEYKQQISSQLAKKSLAGISAPTAESLNGISRSASA